MVSVVIPTYNASGYLPKLILALSRQTLSHELIVLDSESKDDTRLLLNKAGISFVSINKGNFNHGGTRNIGLEMSKYDIVIFMTQDALPATDDTLERLVDRLSSSNQIAMAYGRQLPYPDTDIFGQFARYANYPSQSLIKDQTMISKMGIKTCSCSNSFAAYHKPLLKEIGGFPEDTILGEDVTVAAHFILRGYSLAYCAEAQVYHSHNYSLGEEFRRYFDIGVFHRQQQKVLHPFTKAESEGLRYVLDESKYLIKLGVSWLLPVQYVRTIAKYVGYRTGWFYHIFPKRFNKLLSMHRSFWK
ncbi:glycosyltransferase family 2 protein [Spirosoma validum]|uniref:Glycosyltransferase family 2 protein n=1 Tax=Spirosoma validum TaxID=2771355 RepID=A0A927AY22_9BACT|nr:glycosyltransferase family A protein [Spirosoma validum]MBD2751863.1 glycosyltransferase family 2 protein [Spirosoma validum]